MNRVKLTNIFMRKSMDDRNKAVELVVGLIKINKEIPFEDWISALGAILANLYKKSNLPFEEFALLIEEVKEAYKVLEEVPNG